MPYILFVFALGACVGSFLNVVVWRVPRGESLVLPPSRCPNCEHRLAWYDNLPVVGWLALRGRCRYCHTPISAEYPTIEFLTGALFAITYVLFFISHRGLCWAELYNDLQLGPTVLHFGLSNISEDWPQYALAVFTIAALLAASLIDARHYFVPMSIPIILAAGGLVYHTILDRPHMAGSLTISNPAVGAMTIGAGIGLMLSNLLVWKGMIRRSFAEAWPALEIEKNPELQEETNWLGRAISRIVESYRSKLTPEQRKVMEQHRAATESREKQLQKEWEAKATESRPPMKEFTRAEVVGEMRREMVFLIPPLLGGMLAMSAALLIQPIGQRWQHLLAGNYFLSGFAGSLLGAMVGGFVVWFARIVFTVSLGREALGLGDVHLMFGVGAIVGGAGATIAFFVAPFVGLLFTLYRFLFHGRRELPYVPYLSVATVLVVFFYCDIVTYLMPGMDGLLNMIRQILMGG